MMVDALYGRQSVEKKDSISVESQLEYCRYETHGDPYEEYADRGFSGKDTHRPDFERMMEDIRSGKIKRVIVYKLDRISRSILDFANMMEFFQSRNVEFVSSTEKFDTSTPIGRAMLNICIVFAQLERETIQKRVRDAYYARSKRGFYMGGRVPYGFSLKKTVIDTVGTSMYEEVPGESGQLKLIYEMYAEPCHSLGDIVRCLNERGIKNLRGSAWNTARLSEMLRNPIYVEADIDVYNFFKSQGADIYNPASDFTGYNACYLYSSARDDTEKRSSLKGKEVVLAPHSGFIPSGIWLACRRRCLNNRQSTRTCRPKNSWLSGKVKCKSCGAALVIRKAKTKWGRYFVCSKSGNNTSCSGTGCTVYAEVLEEYMASVIREKLSEFERLTGGNRYPENPRTKQHKLRLTQIDEEIRNLLSKIGGADEVLMRYISSRISELDVARSDLIEESKRPARRSSESGLMGNDVINHTELWDKITFEDKQAVTDILIKKISIGEGIMEITWNL